MPSASLWAAVPHYVAVAPNPKGALALLRRLESLVGVTVDAMDLETAAVRLRPPGHPRRRARPRGPGVRRAPRARRRRGGAPAARATSRRATSSPASSSASCASAAPAARRRTRAAAARHSAAAARRAARAARAATSARAAARSSAVATYIAASSSAPMKHVGERAGRLLGELPGVDRGAQHRLGEAEPVAQRHVAEAVPAEHDRAVEQQDLPDLGLLAGLEPAVDRGVQRGGRVAGAAGDDVLAEPRGHVGLDRLGDGEEQRRLVGELVVHRAARDARRGGDLGRPDVGVAALPPTAAARRRRARRGWRRSARSGCVA